MIRGRALTSIATTAPNEIYIAPFGSLDAKVGYRLNRTLKLYFEGKNLTNYWFKEETGIHANLVSTAIKDGRTFVPGASMSF
jgi:outer membrane receptor for monomeric catechols